MRRYSIIIQGEGKGHFSQALAVIKILEAKGDKISRVYLGMSFLRKTPSYFYTSLNVPVKSFFSPNFMRTPDKKGIRIFSSILLNLLLSPVYLFEASRIGILMIGDRSKYLINFYDPVGALASRWWKRRASKTILSHHFYLSHPDFLHPHGMGNSNFWLQLMNRFMTRSADNILALSYRKSQDTRNMKVIPPLIDEGVKAGTYRAGDRDLCYFLNPGFVAEMINYYRKRPEQKVDFFTSAYPDRELPENITIHAPSRELFLEAMLSCKRIISTAGFDTVAEAFYLGIPIYLIPSENHYEQYCNAIDAARTGLAFHLEELSELDEVEFEPKSNKSFKAWVDSVVDLDARRFLPPS